MVMQRVVDILVATTLLGMIASGIAIGNDDARTSTPIVVGSPAFAASALIPARYTCKGADDSPPLTWHGIPPAAKTLALVVDDPDAPSGTFTHWIVYNIDAASSGLPANALKNGKVAAGYLQGVNDFGRVGYNGPCPPPGMLHHYHFKVYALETVLRLPSDARVSQLERAMRGRILASGDLIATFAR